MKKLVLILFMLQSSLLFAQTDLGKWEGKWRGELDIYNEKGLVQTIPMGINIIKDGPQWKWQIIYNEGESQNFRDYTLLPTANPSQFELDENNGIILKMSYLHDTFHSVFEMNQTVLLVSYSLKENELVFRSQYSPAANMIESEVQGEETQKIEARETTNYQIAYLKKS